MTHRICTRCLVDDTAPVTFDMHGVCSYCREYILYVKRIEEAGLYSRDALKKRLTEVRKLGEGCDYDCVLGISGGVDSSFLCHLMKTWGLRPLLVHFDNGWNTDISICNIQALVDKTGFDLYTYVVDWKEFRELQKAYFRASVIDVEVLTDHGLMATLYKEAKEFNIKTVVIGQNYTTEFIMPGSWNFYKWDLINIRAICEQFSSMPISSFPVYGALGLMGSEFNYFEPLQFIQFNKEKAIRLLEQQYGWRRYSGKHYESAFTKFYQAYYLPVKFGIDKRRIHLSNLIWSGQMTRKEALYELEKPLYGPHELEIEKNFVLKKLGMSQKEWDTIMATPPVPHQSYACAPPELANAISKKIQRRK